MVSIILMLSCVRAHPHWNIVHEKLDHHFIQPEAISAPGEKSQMPAVLGCNQLQKRVGPDRRVLEHLKRNERVILRRDEQGWHADPVEEGFGRLRRVVM